MAAEAGVPSRMPRGARVAREALILVAPLDTGRLAEDGDWGAAEVGQVGELPVKGAEPEVWK